MKGGVACALRALVASKGAKTSVARASAQHDRAAPDRLPRLTDADCRSPRRKTFFIF
jgi:hypothetical protein